MLNNNSLIFMENFQGLGIINKHFTQTTSFTLHNSPFRKHQFLFSFVSEDTELHNFKYLVHGHITGRGNEIPTQASHSIGQVPH